ncbi:MAG: hypothetical protein ACLQU1_00835 [Bryobacteraceae bacterium]
MLPSGLMCTADQDVRVSEVGAGMYVVEDAYEGEYDFFAPSRLYSTREQIATQDKSTASKDLSKK